MCVCVTLHSLQLVCLYDDAQLQHQLWSALQKGGQKMQHAHICELIHHPPVVTPALRLGTLTTPNAQVDGVEIPRGNGDEDHTSASARLPDYLVFCTYKHKFKFKFKFKRLYWHDI